MNTTHKRIAETKIWIDFNMTRMWREDRIKPTTHPLNLQRKTKFVSYNVDSKTRKGVKLGWLTGIQYFAPSDGSGVIDVCPDASDACIKSCLNTAGRASFDPKIQDARIFRTMVFVQAKTHYWEQTIKDIEALIRAAQRKQLIPCVRMNGTADLPWERMKIKGTKYDGLTLMQAFPGVQFYDYTKTIKRLGTTPDNYYLLASYSENMTLETMHDILKASFNVAVVFRVCEHKGNCKCALPSEWQGVKVINGDKSDVRFEDPQGVIVGLKAKGKAKYDTDGFVINVSSN